MSLGFSRFFLTFIFAVSILSEAVSKPLLTQYNLDFESAKSDSVPAQWIVANATVTGYSACLDRQVKRHGRSSMRVKWDTIAIFNRGGFQQLLPGPAFAGKDVELSGWVKVKNISDNKYATIALVEKTASGKYNQRVDTLYATDSHVDWTRLSVKMRINDSTKYIALIGGFSGKGVAWFDDFELRIEGKQFKDHKISPAKTQLSLREKRQFQKYIHPIRSVDPDENDMRDLEVFRQLIGDSRVVALGENTHGTSEVETLKDRIIRYLATKENFNIFALEAGVPECDKVNEYILKGDGDAREAIRGLSLWPWTTEEMLSMVEWMQNYNTSGAKLRFTGLDLQMYDPVMQQLVQTLEDCPTASALAIELYDKIKSLYPQPYRMDRDLAKKIDEGLNELSSIQDISTLPDQRQALVYRYIAMLHRFLSQREDIDWRDRGMAENLMWILQRYPETRILLWAHDGHVGTHYSTTRGSFPMGGFVKEQIGQDYTSFGFASYAGEYTAWRGGNKLKSFTLPEPLPGTLEYLLAQIDEPAFVLNMKKMREDNSTILQWIDNMEFRIIGSTPDIFYEKGVTCAFDYLIFIKNISPTHILEKP